jgi:hypothetical protein
MAVESCEGYTNALAAFDILPIIAFGVGFWFLTTVFRGQDVLVQRAVKVAAVLLVLGAAVAGPGRKFVIANQDMCDLHKEFQLPFFLPMPLAFLLLAWAAVSLYRDRRVTIVPFAATLAGIWVLTAIAQDRLVSLAAAGLIAVYFAFVMAAVSRKKGDLVAAGPYVLYAVGTLALPGLGSAGNAEESSWQWLEQGTNAVTLTLFALASYRLRNAYLRSGDRSVLVER